jgi:hypothetical protein
LPVLLFRSFCVVCARLIELNFASLVCREVTKVLADAGANLESKDRVGETALMKGVQKGHT